MLGSSNFVREFQSLIVGGGGGGGGGGGEETGLINISPSQWGLKCQGMMIPGMPVRGDKVTCGYTGCTL